MLIASAWSSSPRRLASPVVASVYWNAYVAVTQMHGHGNFADPRLKIDVKQSPDMVTPKLVALAAGDGGRILSGDGTHAAAAESIDAREVDRQSRGQALEHADQRRSVRFAGGGPAQRAHGTRARARSSGRTAPEVGGMRS